MKCFEQSKDDDIDEYVIDEFTNLETAIFSYMDNMKEYTERAMTDKEIMKITKRDSNYFIKQWEKKQ